jgi:predicted AAA+ superfamily ATPase
MRRLLNPLQSNSFFLFGARGTGKTWLLKSLLAGPNVTTIDLLGSRDFDRYSQHPELLSELIAGLGEGAQWVVIDEVQKVPAILDMVHLEIEAHSRSSLGVTKERPAGRKILFALTGSSARKLKRGRANLLAGRAFLNYLFPLTSLELPDEYSLNQILEWGTLPRVVGTSDLMQREEFLFGYVNTYLREEILEEQLARSGPPFRKFLEVAAQSNGQIVNYSKIGEDVGLSSPTIASYFQILEDTLLAHRIDAFHLSVRKRQRQAPKYYFFDLGVQRALSRALGQALPPANYGFGRAFEHFVVCELIRLASYKRLNWDFSYLMTKDQVEIDLIIEPPGRKRILVEIKSTDHVTEADLKSLRSLGKEIEHSEKFVLSLDKIARSVDGIKILHWKDGLRELGLVDTQT